MRPKYKHKHSFQGILLLQNELSLGHKNVHAVKEEVETLDFNCYRNTKKKILLRRKWSESR